MTVDSSDDDDDARKPAARPTGGSAILSSPLPPSAAAPPPPTPLATERTVLQPVEGELAFLVTHWLSGFARSQQQQQDEKTRNHKDPVIVNGDGSGNDNQDPQHNNSTTRAAALAKIHTAAASLAEAFAALGTFGSAATKVSSGCLLLLLVGVVGVSWRDLVHLFVFLCCSGVAFLRNKTGYYDISVRTTQHPSPSCGCMMIIIPTLLILV